MKITKLQSLRLSMILQGLTNYPFINISTDRDNNLCVATPLDFGTIEDFKTYEIDPNGKVCSG